MRFAVFVVALMVVALPARDAFAETVVLTVHDYPTGDGPPGLASNGIPFAPGALYDTSDLKLSDGSTEIPVAARELARWHGDNSIRAILLQFDASFAGPSKTYSLAIGEPATLTDTLATVTWDFPTRIIALPAGYLCSSQILGSQKPFEGGQFAAWEQKCVNRYHEIEYEGATLGDCANSDQYYNSISSSYQLYARTGDIAYLINGRKWALHHARNQIYLSGPYIGHGKCGNPGGMYNDVTGEVSLDRTRYTYVRGLVDDYFLWGGEEAKSVAGIVVDNFFMTHDNTFYYLPPGSTAFWTEREAGFALIGLLAYHEATNDMTYLDRATQRVDSLYQMQADTDGGAWPHDLNAHDPGECASSSQGVSPWMTGLLLEGIVRYHQVTGSFIARQSILWALDYLADHCLATTGPFAGESFVYLYGCANPAYTYGVPDVDNHISRAFAYGYRITGNIEYRDIALAVFNTCVDDGWTGTAKHYNQQFRSSGHAVAYLSEGVVAASLPQADVAALELPPNFPNPFNPQTAIRYVLPAAGDVRIGIYDARGRLVREILNERRHPGRHSASWDGMNQAGSVAASGVYIVRLESNGQVRTRKVVLLK